VSGPQNPPGPLGEPVVETAAQMAARFGWNPYTIQERDQQIARYLRAALRDGDLADDVEKLCDHLEGS
jgi:hypothetical protein